MEKSKVNNSINISEQMSITGKFLVMESVHKRLNALGHFAAKRKPSPLTLNIGGKSYTDGKKIVVSLPIEAMEMAFTRIRKTSNFGMVNLNKAFEIIYLFIETLYFHELYHELCSNFKDFKRYNEEETLILTNLGVSEMFAEYVVHSIGNIIEDGRIENIAGNEMPGSIRKFQFVRYFFWSKNEIKGKESQLQAAIQAILSLSALGVYPRNYGKFFTNSPADREIDKIIHLINEGITSHSCKDGLDKSREILKIIQPFILSEYEILSKDQEIMDELMEMLEEIIESTDFKNSEESTKSQHESNTSSIHNQLPEKPKEQEKKNTEDLEEESLEESEQEPDIIEKIMESDSKLKSEEDEEEEEKKPDKKYSKEKEKSHSKEMQLKEGDPEEMASGTKGKNDSNSDEAQDSIEKINDISEARITDSNIDKTSDEDIIAEGDHPLSTGYEVSSGEQEIMDGYLEEELSKWMEDITKDLTTEVRDMVLEFDRVEIKNDKEDKLINTDDLLDAGISSYGFKEFPNNFNLKSKLPPTVRVKADKLKKEIEEIFRNKQSLSLRHQQKGVLNTSDLYKVALRDYNVFNTRGNKDISDYVVYILLDGSGSMSGDKEVQQAYASSIIEYALKDILPFKITVFTSSKGIEHHVVKNWNDLSSESYSYNFLQYRRASGENDDGISIKIATQELLKRQEKDKILIVLSDGLPSSLEDTKNAVKEAKDKGIYVTGIIFGNEDFRKKNFEKIIYMYETNVISVEPNIIPNKLAQILKQIISR